MWVLSAPNSSALPKPKQSVGNCEPKEARRRTHLTDDTALSATVWWSVLGPTTSLCLEKVSFTWPPSMIAHYIDAHAYAPPAVFWEAVMKCPEMWSDAYAQALILDGPTNEKWNRVVARITARDRKRV